MKLKNSKVCFEMNLKGSAFTVFKLIDNPVNPFDWKLPNHRLPETNIGSYDFEGHFLCLGTWGMPTEGEKKAGLKFYGEVNTEIWKIIQPIQREQKSQTVITSCESPVEKLDVIRKVELFDDVALMKITEQVTNNLPIGRPYNILQHATIGGAFVQNPTILNSNAGKGFYQNSDYVRETYQDIEMTSYDWPNAVLPDTTIDLTLSNQIEKSFVSTHVFSEEEENGWATLTNVKEGFMIGYLWDKKEYPWLNVWHQFEEGTTKSRAIEFATCGMWQSFEYMMSNDSRFFGQNSFEFIDAGATKQKSYYQFLVPVAEDFIAVKKIIKKETSIEIVISNRSRNEIELLYF